MTFSVVILYGCNPTIIPLQGNYGDKPREIVTTKSVDSVWSHLNAVFMKNGLPIKKRDTNKGMIRTKKVSLNSIYTFEDNNGRLEQPEAWVVLMKDFNREKQWKPKSIYSLWNVQNHGNRNRNKNNKD